MNEFTTLIEKLNESQFQNIVSLSYYIGVKQIVDQLLSEDDDYCQWKLQQFRTGEDSTMGDLIEEYLSTTTDDVNEYTVDGKAIGQNGEEPYEQSLLGFGHEDFIKKHNLPFSTQTEETELERDANFANVAVSEDEEGALESNNYTEDRSLAAEHNEDDINTIPDDLIFPKDLYESIIKQNTDAVKELSDPEKLKLLGDNLDTAQMDRFELYRRSKLPKTLVRRLIGTVTNQSVQTSTALYMCAVGKIFLGEIVEKALHIKKKSLISHSFENLNLRKVYGNRILKILKKITKAIENSSNNSGPASFKSSSKAGSGTANNSSSMNSSLSNKLQYNLGNDDLDYLFNEDSINCDTIFPTEDSELMENNDLEEDDYYENVKDTKQQNLKTMLKNLKVLLEYDYTVNTSLAGEKSLSSSSSSLSFNTSQFGKLKSLVIQYNFWLEKFNALDCNIDIFENSPLQPEHVREAWRLYRQESDTLPPSAYRLQGEGTGWLF
ncbi:hypothetical protein ACO0QE_000724 [Hanseniaspora vineae]